MSSVCQSLPKQSEQTRYEVGSRQDGAVIIVRPHAQCAVRPAVSGRRGHDPYLHGGRLDEPFDRGGTTNHLRWPADAVKGLLEGTVDGDVVLLDRGEAGCGGGVESESGGKCRLGHQQLAGRHQRVEAGRLVPPRSGNVSLDLDRRTLRITWSLVQSRRSPPRFMCRWAPLPAGRLPAPRAR